MARLLFMVSREEWNPRAAGGDVQGSAYARYLAEAGHGVTYLTSSYPGAPGDEFRDGVRFRRLGPAGALAPLLWRYYRRHGDGFDAVYAEAIGGSRLPFLAPLYVRQPLVAPWYQVNRPVFIHEYGRLRGSALGRMEALLARLHRNATILTPTEARRKDLIEMAFRPEQVLAIPPVAVDPQPEDAPPLASRAPLVVWLGKIRRYKCVHHCIEAMPRVLAACPDARLVIAGRREDERYLLELRGRIRRLGLDACVEFAFDLTEPEKRGLLGSARLVTLPSPVEGFGIVLLEAATLGTPAVVSQGVPEEVIADGYNGLRVPFADTDALGEAIGRLLSSPTLHQRLAANAIGHARTFSRPAIQARLEEVFRQVMGERQRVAV